MVLVPLNFIYMNPQDSWRRASFYFHPHSIVAETERKFRKLIMGKVGVWSRVSQWREGAKAKGTE